jgi:SsrA-binding protein
MRGRSETNFNPRINNRKAMHDYFISAKLECGIALLGSEVKSLRLGKCQLAESFARIENGELVLHGCHIDPYEKAHIGHEPLRERKLLAHRREIKRLENETATRGVTLIPLAIYFKDGRAKIEIGVAHGKQQYDKRATIKRKEQDRALRRATMTHRR